MTRISQRRSVSSLLLIIGPKIDDNDSSFKRSLSKINLPNDEKKPEGNLPFAR